MDTFLSYIAKIFLCWFWLVCPIMVDSGMSNLRAQCNGKDQHILLNFKRALIDPSHFLSTWSGERDCCKWTGVQCDNTTNRITKLRLPCSIEAPIYGYKQNKSHCLTGELDLSLLQLEFLNHLDLSNNDFRAIRYDSSQNSSNLHYLDLSFNQDLDIHNLQWLSCLSSLKFIDFSSVDLHKETNWFQSLTMLPSLSELHLARCQLKNINPSLQYSDFTSLEVVDLSYNDFGSQLLPNWLFNLSSHISDIHLTGNYFIGQLPQALLNLRNLVSLDLSKNRLFGPLPDWFGELEHLEYLDVSDNLFSGPIPLTFGNMSSLIRLNFNNNLLNGSLPESLAQLSNLKRLGVSFNSFTGVVSERNFVKLSNLKVFLFGSPAIVFDFDPLWVPPFQLEILFLEFVGSKLPRWLYTQTSLKWLRIGNSRISFESDEDKFWNFTAQLELLNLEDNSIDVDMSNVLLNSTISILPSNNFKGNLPQLSPSVILFDMSNNSMSGSISSLLCQKMNSRSQLSYLDVSNNLLSGGLTNCWVNWQSLHLVKLGNNNLTGKIPPSMSFLSNLVTLHLSRNSLFGEVPPSLKNCKNLQILNLGENHFSGNIPNWMGHNIKALQLRSNQFKGNIPPQICQLSSLIILDFADNRISGTIPHCLHNMTTMIFNNASNNERHFTYSDSQITYVFEDILILFTKGQQEDYGENLKLMRAIDLSSNNLCGPIPLEIVSLTGLISLNLSHNQFIGNIPKEIGKLKQLESLDLSSNQLSNEIPQSIVELSFLSFLNLSFNNLNGKIPLGTQLQGFDVLSYLGNPKLCGSPLSKNCVHEEDIKPIGEYDNNDSEFLSSLYIGMGIGFATAFCTICGAIFFNKTWRYTYFRFLDHVKDKLYVMVILKMNRIR